MDWAGGEDVGELQTGELLQGRHVFVPTREGRSIIAANRVGTEACPPYAFITNNLSYSLQKCYLDLN
jgi:hypothetical protein